MAPLQTSVFFLFLSCVACLDMQEFEASRRQSRIQRHLKRLNKPAITSFESPDGDTIDCVLLSQQPAFDHPKLKFHKIQTEPTFPSGMEQWATQSETFENSKPQIWHEIGKCPKETIPIRRTKEKDLMRAKAFKDYGKKFHHPAKIVPPPGAINVLNENGHQHAIAYVQGGSYYGAKAVMNVWELSTEVPNEFSLSQIWVLAGSFQGDLNSIEAGWQSDAYHATGCYNLLCSGFVQISNEIAMGASISPVKLYGLM